MTLPRPRRNRKRRPFNGSPADHAATEQSLSGLTTDPEDGAPYQWGGGSDLGMMPAGGGAVIIFRPAPQPGTVIEVTRPAPPALPARTPQHPPRRHDTRPGDDGAWDRSPQALRAVAGALRGQPPPRPPAIRPLPPELPPHDGLPAAQVTAMLGAIRYPGTDGTPEGYAAVIRRWSHLTGTASGLENPGAWPRHAIEPGAS